MPRYIAFLRAINVGGRTVKMDRLRAFFEELKFKNVETFIASGNVIFESPSKAPAALEKKIESHLKQRLGYDVATCLRTSEELAAIAAHRPFHEADTQADGARVYVGFLRDEAPEDLRSRLDTLKTPVDEFQVHGREFYWLCRVSMADSLVSNAILGKALSTLITTRNLTTVRRLAAKYAG